MKCKILLDFNDILNDCVYQCCIWIFHFLDTWSNIITIDMQTYCYAFLIYASSEKERNVSGIYTLWNESNGREYFYNFSTWLLQLNKIDWKISQYWPNSVAISVSETYIVCLLPIYNIQRQFRNMLLISSIKCLIQPEHLSPCSVYRNAGLPALHTSCKCGNIVVNCATVKYIETDWV